MCEQNEPDFAVAFVFDSLKPPLQISIYPNLMEIDDEVQLLIIASCLRVLSRRHGAERALDMVGQIACGRLGGKSVSMNFKNTQ